MWRNDPSGGRFAASRCERAAHDLPPRALAARRTYTRPVPVPTRSRSIAAAIQFSRNARRARRAPAASSPCWIRMIGKARLDWRGPDRPPAHAGDADILLAQLLLCDAQEVPLDFQAHDEVHTLVREPFEVLAQ